MNKTEQEFVEAIKTKDEFSEKDFINALMDMVNSFSFRSDEIVNEVSKLGAEEKKCFEDALDSCVYALNHSDYIDGRNECAAKLCEYFDIQCNPMPKVGKLFMTSHPTLQQSAIGFFGNYIDKNDLIKPETLKELRDTYGEKWYCCPLI